METANNAKKKMGLGKKILIGIGVFILIGVIANLGKDENSASGSVGSKASTSTESHPTIGQPLKTDYFEVTVSNVEITKTLKSHQEYIPDEVVENGNKYLVMTTTFKNIDKESRTLFVPGTVFINYNGKEYTFDNAEQINLEGYNILLDAINPLVSKTTKLVYKLPEEMKGAAYYQPDRADDDERILLGNVE